MGVIKSAIFAWFGPSPFENHFGELTKLMQAGTVQEHVDAFETALGKIKGLPQDQLVACFISGLKPNIVAELEISEPPNLTTATLRQEVRAQVPHQKIELGL